MTVEELDRGVEDLVHVPGPHVAPVVDEDVDPAPMVEDGGHRRLQGGRFEQVEGDGQGAPSGVLDQGGGGVQ